MCLHQVHERRKERGQEGGRIHSWRSAVRLLIRSIPALAISSLLTPALSNFEGYNEASLSMRNGLHSSCSVRCAERFLSGALKDLSGLTFDQMVTRIGGQELGCERKKVRGHVANMRLRGGGGSNQDFDVLQQLLQVGDQIGKILDKEKGAMSSYYDSGDKTLQEWAGKMQKKAEEFARSSQQYICNVVVPSSEEAVLRGYFLATHPPEALAAFDDFGRSAMATAKDIKNTIPGVKNTQQHIRVTWLTFRVKNPVSSEVVSCAAAAVVSYLTVTAAAQRLAYRHGVTFYTKMPGMTLPFVPAQMLGVCAVALGGALAGEATHAITSRLRPNTYRLASLSPHVSVRQAAARLPPTRPRGMLERCADAAVSVAFFKGLLRGSFRKIAPADLTKPGPFAREWVETKGENYAAYGQRVRIG